MPGEQTHASGRNASAAALKEIAFIMTALVSSTVSGFEACSERPIEAIISGAVAVASAVGAIATNARHH